MPGLSRVVVLERAGVATGSVTVVARPGGSKVVAEEALLRVLSDPEGWGDFGLAERRGGRHRDTSTTRRAGTGSAGRGGANRTSSRPSLHPVPSPGGGGHVAARLALPYCRSPCRTAPVIRLPNASERRGHFQHPRSEVQFPCRRVVRRQGHLLRRSRPTHHPHQPDGVAPESAPPPRRNLECRPSCPDLSRPHRSPTPAAARSSALYSVPNGFCGIGGSQVPFPVRNEQPAPVRGS
jgi:hypothetical protein